jgi:hypothetical protein
MNSAVNRLLAKYQKLPTLRAVAKGLSAFVSFRYHHLIKRPYFGPFMASRQLSPIRAPFMRPAGAENLFRAGKPLGVGNRLVEW